MLRACRAVETTPTLVAEMETEQTSELDATEIDWPEWLLCPISGAILVEPVVIGDGFTFEREAITSWFELGHETSPCTGAKLKRNERELVPNRALQAAVTYFLKTHPEAAKDLYVPGSHDAVRASIDERVRRRQAQKDAERAERWQREIDVQQWESEQQAPIATGGPQSRPGSSSTTRARSPGSRPGSSSSTPNNRTGARSFGMGLFRPKAQVTRRAAFHITADHAKVVVADVDVKKGAMMGAVVLDLEREFQFTSNGQIFPDETKTQGVSLMVALAAKAREAGAVEGCALVTIESFNGDEGAEYVNRLGSFMGTTIFVDPEEPAGGMTELLTTGSYLRW